MSVNAIMAAGTVFKRGDGASNEAFTALSEINSVGLPEQSRPMIDVSDLDSTAREFIPGLLDSGQVAVEMNFTRDSYIDMKADLNSTTARNYQIVLNDTGSTTIDFSGHVQSIGGGAAGPDDKIPVTVSIKVSGAVTVSS